MCSIYKRENGVMDALARLLDGWRLDRHLCPNQIGKRSFIYSLQTENRHAVKCLCAFYLVGSIDGSQRQFFFHSD